MGEVDWPFNHGAFYNSDILSMVPGPVKCSWANKTHRRVVGHFCDVLRWKYGRLADLPG